MNRQVEQKLTIIKQKAYGQEAGKVEELHQLRASGLVKTSSTLECILEMMIPLQQLITK